MSAAQGQPDKRKESTYVLDAESESEMARLLRQDRLLTEGMGGILSEQTDISSVQRALDIACGPGGWVLDVAFTYQDMEVVGIDISERMITYANAQAQAQGRSNASFRVMNALGPLAFPSASFDLVNARFISPFVRREMWPTFFAECLRILRPGGTLRLTELEWGISNKASFEKACQMFQHAMTLIGNNFSPNGLHHGIIQMLPRFFQQAGLQHISQKGHVLDFSASTAPIVRDGYYHDLSSAFPAIEPVMAKTQLLSVDAWRELYQQGLAEMYEEDFCSMYILLTVWGQKAS